MPLDKQSKLQAIRVLSVLTSRYLQLWNTYYAQYDELSHQLDEFVEGIHELHHGKVNPKLVPPFQMREAIRKADKTLSEWKRDY